MKESEIRPQPLLERYLKLSALDAATYFPGSGRRRGVPCVGCGGNNSIPRFVKNGFGYSECVSCGSLYQTPRPRLATFDRFYRDSPSSRFWAEVFFPAVAETRREKIFRPRVSRLQKSCSQAGVRVRHLIDVGAGFGIFLDEWRRRFPSTRAVAVEPSVSLAEECRRKGFEVVEATAEAVRGHDRSADLVTCFEVLEHVYSPVDFIRNLARLARPGGLVMVSTLSIDGFDLRILGRRAQQISPPHHINFLSISGLRTLFARAGLVDVSVTTPGELDVDIVRNASRRLPSLLKRNAFLKSIFADDRLAAEFQLFLQEQNLSSHVWVTGRRTS